MPVRRRAVARIYRSLSWEQKSDLLRGPRRQAAFASDEERRLAWEIHGEALIASVNYIPGSRCAAWWDYESPEPRGENDWDDLTEAQHLRRMGLLSPQEIADFEKARRCSIDDVAHPGNWQPYRRGGVS